MNERIRQLAKEAGITTNIDTDYFERDMNKWVDYFSEKFAELIVAECAKVIHDLTPIDYMEMDTMHRIRDSVKEHFGVEG